VRGRQRRTDLAKDQRNAPGDTKDELHPEKTPLLAVTKEPNHTQNDSHAIMRQGKKEEQGEGEVVAKEGSRGWGTEGRDGGLALDELRTLKCSGSEAAAFGRPPEVP